MKFKRRFKVAWGLCLAAIGLLSLLAFDENIAFTCEAFGIKEKVENQGFYDWAAD